MRKIAALFLACALCAAGPALGRAEAVYRMTGRPHETLPEMTFTIEDTGERNEEDEHMLLLRVEAEDGGYGQEMRYPSLETVDGYVELARLDDVNFDGVLDLVLTHAQGASNGYVLVAPWLPEAGRFSEPVEGIRLCNYVLYPQQRHILSTEKDGAASYRHQSYAWVGGTLTLLSEGVMERVESSGRMRERLVKYDGDGAVRVCWDDEYPSDWYIRVWEERWRVMESAMIDGAQRPTAAVDNVDWVNLRKQDSKDSPSLARLDAGTTVDILAEGCGEDGGWVRVLAQIDGQSLTGYIWHSFLRRLN